jgi:hypothetical protein
MGSNFILGISSACYVQSMLYKIYLYIYFYGNVGNIIQFSVFMAHSLSLVYIFFPQTTSIQFHTPEYYFILYIFFSSPLLLVCLSQADFSVALKKPYQFLVQFSFFVFNSASSFGCLSCLDFFYVSVHSFCCWPMSVYWNLMTMKIDFLCFVYEKSTCEWTLKRMPSLMESIYFHFCMRDYVKLNE